MNNPRLRSKINLIALIDAINELKRLQTLVYAAIDILSQNTGQCYTKEKAIDYSSYLLALYETELKVVMDEIEDICSELQKSSTSLGEKQNVNS